MADRWQPIETAPKDGTVVLGFDPTRDDDEEDPLGGMDFMRWMNAMDDEPAGWYDPSTHSMNPTLWAKLPAPPAEGGK